MHAAGLSRAYPTACGAPADAGRLRDGETVLIHGGAGGVRSAAARVLGHDALFARKDLVDGVRDLGRHTDWTADAWYLGKNNRSIAG